jgi:hypothetical protein
MSSNPPPQKRDNQWSWLEYILILILVILVVVTITRLFGPYIKTQVIQLCTQYELPCR